MLDTAEFLFKTILITLIHVICNLHTLNLFKSHSSGIRYNSLQDTYFLTYTCIFYVMEIFSHLKGILPLQLAGSVSFCREGLFCREVYM